MATLSDYLIEVQLGENSTLNDMFNIALKQAFSPQYLQMIQDVIRKTIEVKYVQKSNPDILAYNSGNKIFINREPFERLSSRDKIKVLLHEFTHLLQRKKGLLFFKQFKAMHQLSQKLYDSVRKNLTKPFSVFLTGKVIKIGPGKEHEILAYLMNDTIHWDGITPEGKSEFIQILKDARIFNLEHPFWKKRLTK